MNNDSPDNEDCFKEPDATSTEGGCYKRTQLISGYRRRKFAKIIRYRNYSREADPENWYRESLLLFHAWRPFADDPSGSAAASVSDVLLLLDSESRALLGGCVSFEERYYQVRETVEANRLAFNGGGEINWDTVVDQAISDRILLDSKDDKRLDRVATLGAAECPDSDDDCPIG